MIRLPALCSAVLISLLLSISSAAQQTSRGLSPELTLDKQAREPFRLFDNVYYVGVEFVASYLIVTSDGLIIIDTLFEDYGDYLPNNIRKLGFDPNEIKYALITHGHRDHYGGATMLQSRFGTQIGAAEGDWQMIEADLGEEDAPSRDRVFGEGDSLTLGDTTIDFLLTPGHTPGVLSMSLTVYDNGTPYKALSFSGAGLNDLSNMEMVNAFRNSIARVRSIPEVEVNIINHPFLLPGFFDRVEKLRNRHKGDKHPFVLEQDEYTQWLDGILQNFNKRMTEARKTVE